MLCGILTRIFILLLTLSKGMLCMSLHHSVYCKLQESRPLGATLVSGCVIAPGCEDHDQDSGVAKPFSFRLKLATTSSILCLAADNQEDYDQWMHSVQHSSSATVASQTPNKENVSQEFRFRNWIIFQITLISGWFMDGNESSKDENVPDRFHL